MDTELLRVLAQDVSQTIARKDVVYPPRAIGQARKPFEAFGSTVVLVLTVFVFGDVSSLTQPTKGVGCVSLTTDSVAGWLVTETCGRPLTTISACTQDPFGIRYEPTLR